MRFGWIINVLDVTSTPSPASLARLLEDGGFESMWIGGHTHVPTSLETARRLGWEMDQTYWGQYDVFPALASAAAATSRLVLGTGVCQLAQREPIVTARAVATVDHLAGGRFVFGVGAGWNREELANHGVAYRSRSARLREHVLAMKEIWGNEVAEFEGEFVRFSPLWQEPKPFQRPHPPIYVAGGSRATLRYVAEFGDGWLPYYSPERAARDLGPVPGEDWPQIEAHMRGIRERAEELGRDPSAIGLSIIGVAPEPRVLEQMADAGVERFIIDAHPFSGKDAILEDIERHQALIESYRRVVGGLAS